MADVAEEKWGVYQGDPLTHKGGDVIRPGTAYVVRNMLTLEREKQYSGWPPKPVSVFENKESARRMADRLNGRSPS